MAAAAAIAKKIQISDVSLRESVAFTPSRAYRCTDGAPAQGVVERVHGRRAVLDDDLRRLDPHLRAGVLVVQDRDEPGNGFTHKQGDIVSIATPTLGRLMNRVTAARAAPPWHFGIGALMANLAKRGLLN